MPCSYRSAFQSHFPFSYLVVFDGRINLVPKFSELLMGKKKGKKVWRKRKTHIWPAHILGDGQCIGGHSAIDSIFSSGPKAPIHKYISFMLVSTWELFLSKNTNQREFFKSSAVPNFIPSSAIFHFVQFSTISRGFSRNPKANKCNNFYFLAQIFSTLFIPKTSNK